MTDMLNELFTRMQYEPYVLMFGNSFQHINTSVLEYNWNLIVTTNCDLRLAKALDNGKRVITDITKKEDMQANLMDRSNLHVIRLFGYDYPENTLDEIEEEDIKDHAVSMLSRVSDIIERIGILIIEDFDEPFFSHKEFRKALKGLNRNQKQVYIFNCKHKDQYLLSLESNGIAVLIEDSIDSYFKEYLTEDSETEYSTSDANIKIYIEADKKMMLTSFSKKDLLETEKFATLLNIDLLNGVTIPQSMYKDYFYMYLRNSVREPQWYGYKYGFNIHREYEEQLLKRVKKGLENIGKPNNKPLLIVGQTGTGKSIALAALAYKIFNEKKYPVIYINDPEISFSSKAEYKQKEINISRSAAFNALDALLEKLENLGAKATLLIWDTSSFSSGRDKIYKLYQALLARGRKVFLVGTAYALIENYSTESEEDFVEEKLMNKKFVECNANVEVSNEIEQLKDILLHKCGMTENETQNIINHYVTESSNYLTMLYQAFEVLRGSLSKGVAKEAKETLNELDAILKDNQRGTNYINNGFLLALRKVEKDIVNAGIVDKLGDIEKQENKKIEVAKDDFVKCISVCSQFKQKMPYDFALRILGTYNENIIRTLTKSTFFMITQDYHDNYEISLRTPQEAAMYISAKSMSPMEEIDCIVKMINNMNPSSGYGQQQETRLCENLIRIIGPNNVQNRYKNKKYKQGYPKIIDSLRELRTNRDIWEPILISQEITYLREYYGRDESLSISTRITRLKEAISIADEIINKQEYIGISAGIRNAIIVEAANSKLLIYQLKETNDTLMFKEVRRDLINVIRYDPSNYHAYVTLLKASVTEYKNESDKIKRLQLLENMCSVADEIIFENPDVADSEYFQIQVAEIYSFLNDSTVLEKYIEELVNNGSTAGLYVMARKKLLENKVDFKKPIENDIQLSACKEIYTLFNNEKYKNLISESETCQYMLLNVVWLMNNKEPIHLEGECWATRMNDDTWKELLGICNNFIMKFCSDPSNEHQVAKNIRYLKALCLAQLKLYTESLSVLKEMEEDSSQGIKRVYTKHMICEADGKTRTFTGRVEKYNERDKTGTLFIEEFGKTHIYFFGPRMKWSDFKKGQIFTDVEIGYSNISPKAFREIWKQEKYYANKGN